MSRPTPSRNHPGFDRVAAVYPRLERLVYGQGLERGRTAFIDELSARQNILLLGEGNGRFLKALLRANTTCAATVVEISPQMITHARSDLSPEEQQRVTWLQTSALDAELPAGSFDAVVTHYLFDLFESPDQARLLATGLGALAPGGLWQDTEFLADGPTHFTRLRNRSLLFLSYRFLGALCDFPARRLSDHRPLMLEAGLMLQAEQTFGHHYAARLWKLPTSTTQ